MTETKLLQAIRQRGLSPVVLVCVVAWTILVAVVLWWLLQGDSSPSIFILREGNSIQPAVSGKFRAWFQADLGLQRIYPWVLFGPYLALMVWWFPLERGRLRLNLPLHLGICLAFVFASHSLNARVGVTGAKVVFVNTQHEVTTAGNSAGTNFTYIRVIRGDAPDFLDQPIGKTLPPTREQELSSRSAAFGMSNLVSRVPAIKPPPGWPGGPRFSALSWVLDLLAYSAIIGTAHSVHYYRRFREREHRALVLESTLANARLNNLRAQLQPHFLFNSLNAIATLLRRDPRLAEATLVSLSELLRLALSQSERQEVALREEMNLVQHYLEIQQTRFGDKLRVEQDIDSMVLDCQVPTLLLQTLVENAIRHGLEPAENASLVRLIARRNGESLILAVEDDGVGLTCDAADLAKRAGENDPLKGARGSRSKGNGIGLKNLRARLQTLYGDDQSLELVTRAEGGLSVQVRIPWRTAARTENGNEADSL